MKPSRILILVNKNAREGFSKSLWNRVEVMVKARLPQNTLVHIFDKTSNIDAILRQYIMVDEVDGFISAGGDGSINHLLNALLRIKDTTDRLFFIGAIGLGSSNDFLKPNKSHIDSIPVRINYHNNQQAEIGELSYTDKQDYRQSRHFLINASIGVTAQANFLFNNPSLALRLLKKFWVNAAIICTALYTIFIFRNYKVTLTFKGLRKNVLLSNLAILRNYHVSGNFKYDSNFKMDKGFLRLFYCSDMNRLELIKTLWGLSKGEFKVSSKRHTYQVKSFKVKTSGYIPIETDGEVFLGQDISFRLKQEPIYLMGH